MGMGQPRPDLELTLSEVPATTLEQLPDEFLRRVFASLPASEQDALHPRLFPDNG
jgi:hypothetical protein